MNTFASHTLRFGVALALTLSAGGCQLILNFDRSLIDAGVDASTFDAGDATIADAGHDGGSDVVIPDAVNDVVFTDVVSQDSGHDSGHDASAGDAGRDGGRDAGNERDASDSGRARDSMADSTPG